MHDRQSTKGQARASVYDPAFFLALARQGRDVWNLWRKENPEIRVNFQGVDFQNQDNGSIDFSGFNFGDHASFRATSFGDGERRAPTTFKAGMGKFAQA